MLKITIFRDTDSEQDILEKLKSDGLVGISGSRLTVRDKLKKVQNSISAEKLEGYWVCPTFNHPDTELGYGYDENKYSLQNAQNLVCESYDENLT